MASQGGNPAARRMNNANLKAKRARSWARGQKRKEQRRKEQAELFASNMARLDELGVVRQVRDRQLKSGKVVQKLESPSEALRRYFRDHPAAA